MNFEVIITILLSYSLGLFTMWIRERCSVKEALDGPVCHLHPDNKA